jgi:uncharacterized protein (TIGR02996 family)
VNPDDDTLRLVFADWLDEHDDPARAEFIRVQVELEPIRTRLDVPRAAELRDREAILLERHGTEWLGPGADVADEYPAFGPVFRRGLPEMVCLSCDTFVRRGGELFAACPTVREVCLFGVSGRGAGLAACPHLANVETLEIADWVEEADMRAIPRSEFLTGLRTARVWLAGQLHYDGWLLLQFAGGRDWRWSWDVDAVAIRTPDDGEGVTNTFPNVVCRNVFRTRFPLDGRLGHGLQAGYLVNGDRAIAATNGRTTVLARLGGDGRLADVSIGTNRFGAETDESVQRRFGLTPALVWAREFDTRENLAVRLWPQLFIDSHLQNLFARPEGWADEIWENRCGVLRRWLHEGRFVVVLNERQYFGDATGRIRRS